MNNETDKRKPGEDLSLINNLLSYQIDDWQEDKQLADKESFEILYIVRSGEFVVNMQHEIGQKEVEADPGEIPTKEIYLRARILGESSRLVLDSLLEEGSEEITIARKLIWDISNHLRNKKDNRTQDSFFDPNSLTIRDKRV